MRRLLCAAVFVVSSLGIAVLPAVADPIQNRATLSYDFSDNDSPASVSGNDFNIIVNVLPEHTTGLIRMVAIAPADANVSNIVCSFQWTSKGHAECAFNFTANGVWAIKAQYIVAPKTEVVAASVTNIRVGI